MNKPCISNSDILETLLFGQASFQIPMFRTNLVLTPIQMQITINLARLEAIMANKKFTAEEMSELKKSKYVLDVSTSIVHFSAEFKEEFWNALIQGNLPKDIVLNMGINPEILGESRLGGLKTMIRNEVKKGDGFRDLNTYMQAGNKYLSAENRIKYLEMQLAYKDQEIDFLKKIVSLNPGEPKL